jgi:hypothetical protein
MTDGTDAFGYYNRAGTPEGFVAADIGSLAVDTSAGALFVKTTDTANTGWLQFVTSASSPWSVNTTPNPDVIYPTTTTFDVAIGGTDTTAPFFFDASAGTLTFDAPGTGTLADFELGAMASGAINVALPVLLKPPT